jgi:hypothetical protein
VRIECTGLWVLSDFLLATVCTSIFDSEFPPGRLRLWM